MLVLFNLVQSQVAWFSAVLLAARGYPVSGTIAALLITALQIGRSEHKRADIRLVLSAAVVGALGDSALAQLNLLSFASGTLLAGWTTPWMIALWMNFATVLNHSLRYLTSRPVIACLVGAVSGPLAYAAGARLGALEFVSWPSALMAIAVEWMIALPILCLIAEAQSSPARAAR